MRKNNLHIFLDKYRDVYKSEALLNTQHAEWEPVVTSLQRLCKGDIHRRLFIMVGDDDDVREGETACKIGGCETSFRELMDAAKTGRTFRLERRNDAERGGILSVVECVYLDD